MQTYKVFYYYAQSNYECRVYNFKAVNVVLIL